MGRLISQVLIFLSLVAALAGCQGQGTDESTAFGLRDQEGPAPGERVSFNTLLSKVLVPKCIQCHFGGSRKGDLSTEDNVRGYVVPGNLALSDLYLRVAGPDADMPYQLPHLRASEVAYISQYITGLIPEAGPTSSPTPTPTSTPHPTPSPSETPNPGPTSNPGAVTYKILRDKILAPKCLNCHGAGSRRGDFSTEAGVLKVVVPKHPEVSDLFLATEQGDMPPSSNGARLTPAQMELIKSYINGL